MPPVCPPSLAASLLLSLSCWLAYRKNDSSSRQREGLRTGEEVGGEGREEEEDEEEEEEESVGGGPPFVAMSPFL